MLQMMSLFVCRQIKVCYLVKVTSLLCYLVKNSVSAEHVVLCIEETVTHHHLDYFAISSTNILYIISTVWPFK